MCDDDLIAEMLYEAQAIGIGSGAPTARLLRRGADALSEVADEIVRLRGIVTDLAATHPQNGYYCLHCGTAINNHALPPGTYTHAAGCLWVRAREAIGETP